MRYIAKKAGERFEKAFQNNNQSSQTSRKPGEVTIDKMPNTHKKSKDTVGEYVDFEEVE